MNWNIAVNVVPYQSEHGLSNAGEGSLHYNMERVQPLPPCKNNNTIILNRTFFLMDGRFKF